MAIPWLTRESVLRSVFGVVFAMRKFMGFSLSRPSFSQQFPLPIQPREVNSQTASKHKSSPSSAGVDDKFIIGPLVRARQ